MYSGDEKLGVLRLCQGTLLPWALESKLKKRGEFDMETEGRHG